MKSSVLLFAATLILGVLTSLYYFTNVNIDVDRTFLSISTFIFSIFTGFFISRQASRFNKVRETVTAFDGKLSSVYRASGHINEALQKEIGVIIAAHYRLILKTEKWNIHFLQPSKTLTNLHALLEHHIEEKEVTKLSNQAIGSVIKSLAACQDIRKQMIAYYEERIPREQWVLIIFFTCTLIGTVSVTDSTGVLFTSVLKAAFVVSVLSVLLILYRLNNLIYSEDIMGKHSADDVLGLISGKR